MIVYNPNDRQVEFFYGGALFKFQPKESRTVDEAMGEFILNRARVGLVEYNVGYDSEMKVDDFNYDTMPWRKLVSLASARKLFKPGSGMDRKNLIEAIKAYDNEKRGTLPNPSN